MGAGAPAFNALAGNAEAGTAIASMIMFVCEGAMRMLKVLSKTFLGIWREELPEFLGTYSLLDGGEKNHFYKKSLWEFCAHATVHVNALYQSSSVYR